MRHITKSLIDGTGQDATMSFDKSAILESASRVSPTLTIIISIFLLTGLLFLVFWITLIKYKNPILDYFQQKTDESKDGLESSFWTKRRRSYYYGWDLGNAFNYWIKPVKIITVISLVSAFAVPLANQFIQIKTDLSDYKVSAFENALGLGTHRAGIPEFQKWAEARYGIKLTENQAVILMTMNNTGGHYSDAVIINGQKLFSYNINRTSNIMVNKNKELKVIAE